MIIFDRAARVQIGPVDVTGLRVSFRVDRTLRRSPSQLEVKVYNLSHASRAAILESVRNNATNATDGLGHAMHRVFVSLDAGYKDNTFRLFHGDVRRVRSEVEIADVITKAWGGDGEVSAFTARANRSFVRGSTPSAVCSYLASVMGVDIGNAREAFRSIHLRNMRRYTDGTVLSGAAPMEMDSLCASAGLEWSVQNNALQLLPIGHALGDSAVVLRPDTGLIGSPTRELYGIVKGKCFLIPEVLPGRRLRVVSRFVDTEIRITKATFVGDTHGPDWYIDWEGRAPRNGLARR